MRLKGKTAIVTGGASGFGAGIVRRFAAEGAQVVIADIDGAAASALAEELGETALAVETDVSDNASVEALVSAAKSAFGEAALLVNNAGIGHTPQPLEELDTASFDRIFAVNIKSLFLTARHLVPAMKRSGRGAILNIASTGAVSPRPNLTWYNASKGWVATATRSMAIELAPWQIRVNGLNPVAGDTPLLKTFMGEDNPETRAKFLDTIPLGRFCTPEDLAAAACYLCSDEASLVTGVMMEVDGGRCI